MRKPKTLAEATELVEELLSVINYLTDATGRPPFDGRFVSVRTDKDVSAEIDPVIARAEGFLHDIDNNNKDNDR